LEHGNSTVIMIHAMAGVWSQWSIEVSFGFNQSIQK
jgi:hypothetical protein